MSTEVKTVLVTGGTGFIGIPLCKQLLTSGYKVYVLTRAKRYLQDRDISYVNAFSELKNIDFDIIINLAGESISKRWTKIMKENIYKSRILTTHQIIDYIRSKEQKPKLLISGSAVGYYGTHAEKTFDESSISNEAQKFSQSLCKKWEDEAKCAEVFGVRVVLLRIGPVLEKDGGMIDKLLPSFYMGLGSQIGDGRQWISWIDRDDLINLILFISSNDHIEGPINATAPVPVTNKDFSLALAKTINRPCFLKTPGFIFKLIFGQMADEIMLKGQKVLPKKALSHGFRFSYPTIEQSLTKIFRS